MVENVFLFPLQALVAAACSQWLEKQGRVTGCRNALFFHVHSLQENFKCRKAVLHVENVFTTIFQSLGIFFLFANNKKDVKIVGGISNLLYFAWNRGERNFTVL